VDGFRFAEAGALAREEGGFEDGSSPFAGRVAAFVATRPGVKLIAEPWDASQDSYHLGGLPQGWSEWNDRFREGVPAFWARQFGLRSQGRGDVGGWLTGSRDVFADRATLASVNYVASHDGLTAADKGRR
jgi:pullulanase/glycogen debranching enzyme